MKIMSKAIHTQISHVQASHQRRRRMMQQRGKQNMGKQQNARQTPVGKLSVFLGHRIVKIQIKCRRENFSVFRHTMFCKSLFQRNFPTE